MIASLHDSQEKIRRFSPARIFEHWLLVCTFLVLVSTGLSQKFFYLDVSQFVITKLGGIDLVRLIHRYAGLLFCAQATLHVLFAVTGLILKQWRPSMVITPKDINDAVLNIRFYAGLEHYPAQCDRFNYKQKFEYWGILLGALVMIASGLALWFPTVITRVLPGEVIPAAKALHSNEALVIVLIVAVWHIYNAIFSPDVFPLDTSIFTGYISRERMLHEHPLELARLEGRVPEHIGEQLIQKIRKNEAPEPSS